MSGARNEAKKLWATQNEVEDLGDEEQKQGFAKMSQDSHDSEGHSGEITQSITRECSGWEPKRVVSVNQLTFKKELFAPPIVIQKSSADANEWEHEVETKEVAVH